MLSLARGFIVCREAAAKPVTLAYNSNALNATLPILVAQGMGLFAKEGQDVSAVFVRSGPTAMCLDRDSLIR